MIKPVSAKYALSVYLRADAPAKVLQCFAETGDFEKIVLYCKKVGYNPDYAAILRMVLFWCDMLIIQVVAGAPDKAPAFAASLVKEDPPLIDIARAADVFMEYNLVQQLTSFLLDALRDNK